MSRRCIFLRSSSDLTLASVRFACPAPAGRSQSSSLLYVNATLPCKTIDNGQLGQGRAEQSRAKQSGAEQARLLDNCYAFTIWPPAAAAPRERTVFFRDGYPAYFRLAREKTSNPIEYFGSGWARSGKDHASPAVVPSFLHPIALCSI